MGGGRFGRLLPLSGALLLLPGCGVTPSLGEVEGVGAVVVPPPEPFVYPALPPFPQAVGHKDGGDLVFERQLAPGVMHRFESRSHGPLTINTVVFDLGREDLHLEAEKGQRRIDGRETVPSMAARMATTAARPLVGINADFWMGMSVPVNMFVDEGMIWKAPWMNEEGVHGRAIFAFDEEMNTYIGSPDWRARILPADGGEIPIDEVNFQREETRTIVYTWPMGEVPPPAGDFMVAVIKLDKPEWLPNVPSSGTVVSMGESPDETLETTTVVVHTRHPFPDSFTVGSGVVLDARLGNLPGRVVGVTGGLPQIVHKGEIFVEGADERASIRSDFLTTRHPRTAIGLKPDGEVVFVTVDGRQPGRSIGIDLYDLAEYMISLGCVEALNCDGGGSTTMAVNGQLVNFPSDASGARTVSNGLFLFRTAPLGPPESLQVHPGNVLLPEGSTTGMTVTAHDAAGELLPWRPEWRVYHGTPGGDFSTPRPSNRFNFHAGSPGEATVEVGLAGIGARSRATFEIAPLETLEFHPPRVLLSVGESIPFRIDALDPKGRPFYTGTRFSNFHVPDIVGYDSIAGTLTARQAGSGRLSVSHKGQEVTALVTVDEYDLRLLDPLDKLPRQDMEGWLNQINMVEEESSLSIDPDRFLDGEASWRLQYAMNRDGGTSRLSLPVGTPLSDEALGVGLRIWGDGSGHWLRGEVRDANGNRFVLDFTDANEGISWDGEWRLVWTHFHRLVSIGIVDQPPTPPFTLEHFYIVQPRRSAKGEGILWIDGVFELLYPEMTH